MYSSWKVIKGVKSQTVSSKLTVQNACSDRFLKGEGVELKSPGGLVWGGAGRWSVRVEVEVQHTRSECDLTSVTSHHVVLHFPRCAFLPTPVMMWMKTPQETRHYGTEASWMERRRRYIVIQCSGYFSHCSSGVYTNRIPTVFVMVWKSISIFLVFSLSEKTRSSCFVLKQLPSAMLLSIQTYLSKLRADIVQALFENNFEGVVWFTRYKSCLSKALGTIQTYWPLVNTVALWILFRRRVVFLLEAPGTGNTGSFQNAYFSITTHKASANKCLNRVSYSGIKLKPFSLHRAYMCQALVLWDLCHVSWLLHCQRMHGQTA